MNNSRFDSNNWEGKSKGIPITNFNIEQLKLGIKSEMEHTNDPRIAARIAADHLLEEPEYYTKLNQFHLDEDQLRKVVREIALPLIQRKLNKK